MVGESALRVVGRWDFAQVLSLEGLAEELSNCLVQDPGFLATGQPCTTLNFHPWKPIFLSFPGNENYCTDVSILLVRTNFAAIFVARK